MLPVTNIPGGEGLQAVSVNTRHCLNVVLSQRHDFVGCHEQNIKKPHFNNQQKPLIYLINAVLQLFKI